MLTQTFLHLPGIGQKTERKLYSNGIRCWADFLSSPPRHLFGRRQLEQIMKGIRQSQDALQKRDLLFFTDLLPPKEHWRVIDDFKESLFFFDIETDAKGKGTTVIGIYDGNDFDSYIKGINLEDGVDRLAEAEILVSFNGTRFDFPFLKKEFSYLIVPPVHLDLFFLFQSIGIKGGLKKIEKACGLSRKPPFDNLNGYDAAIFWMRYQNGNRQALCSLIEYNAYDVIHLAPLLHYVCQKMQENLFSANA